MFICLFFGDCVFGQSVPTEHYSLEQGLPSSEVHDIIQDDYGYLWFATDHGLSRYDGYQFENYGLNEGLPNAVNFRFWKRKNGEIWCNSYDHSIFYFTGREPQFNSFEYNDTLKAILSDRSVDHELYIDDARNVFLSYAHTMGYLWIDSSGKLVNNSLHILDADRLEKVKFEMMVSDGERVFSYIRTSSQQETTGFNLRSSPWHEFSTSYLRTCYLKQEDVAVFMTKVAISISTKEEYKQLDYFKEPVSVGKFDESHFWVGYRLGGVKVFTKDGEEVYHLLRDKTVTKMYRDSEGSWWLATLSEGVFRINNLQVKSTLSIGKYKDWIYSLSKDSSGNLLVGTYYGELLARHGSKFDCLYTAHYRLPVEVNHKNGWTYFTDVKGFYVLDGDGYKQIHPRLQRCWEQVGSGLITGSVSHIYTMRGNTVTDSIVSKYRLNCLHHFNGKVYAGTRYGLFEIIENELVPTNQNIPLGSIWLQSLASAGNKLLIGTLGRGLGILEGENWIQISKAKGLAGDHVLNIYVENEHCIWVGTTSGLSRLKFTGADYHITNFTRKEGLASSYITDMEIINDTIWVGTKKGLCYFPKRLLEEQSGPGPSRFFSLTGVSVNDSLITMGSEIELTYDQNRVEFTYLGISFKKGNSLKYRYKLKGLKEDWVYTRNRSALYNSLPPGNYTFTAQVQNDAEEWGEEASVDFVILPPFWKTWWFRTSLLAAFLLLAYLFFRFKILTYNQDITRELLRRVVKRFKGDELYVVLRDQGKDIKLPTANIGFAKSDGNYVSFHTIGGKFLHRMKFSEFMNFVPDPLEYIQVHRSYIVRLDKVEQKGSRELVILGETIPVSRTYAKELKKINFEV